MIISERQGLVDVRAKALGVVGTTVVLFVENDGAVLAYSNRA